jgi:hypothetical protein
MNMKEQHAVPISLNKFSLLLQILENESANKLVQSEDNSPNNGVIRPGQGQHTHGQRRSDSSTGCCS